MKIFGLNLFKSTVPTKLNSDIGYKEFRKVNKNLIELNDWFYKNPTTDIKTITQKYKKAILTTEEKHKLSQEIWENYKKKHNM